MSKYNKGDKFVIEIDEVFDTESFNEKGNLYKIKGFNSLVFDDYGIDKLSKLPDSIHTDDEMEDEKAAAYDAGINDAWEAVKKIALGICEGGLSNEELYDIFHERSSCSIINNFSASDAIEKIKSYEAKKEDVCVGDVMQHKDHKDVFIVVTAVYSDGRIDGIKITKNDGHGELYAAYANRSIEKWRKTGGHYDLNKIFMKNEEINEIPFS